MKQSLRSSLYPSTQLRLENWSHVYRSEGQRWGLIPSLCAHLALIDIDRASQGNGFLIEIGCGYGRDLALFRSVFSDLVMDALEGAPEAIQLASGLLPILRLRHLMCADILSPSLPIEPGKYDIVYTNYFLHLFDQHEMASILEKIAHLLKPEGRAIFSLVSTEDPKFGKGRELASQSYEIFPGIPWHFFNDREADEIFAAAGMRVVRRERFSEVELVTGHPDRVESLYICASPAR